MRVAELEAALLAEFPASQAEPWDRMGMLVGDPQAQVEQVAVALDPTLSALDFAESVGANVLVTHHPLFLDPPTEVKPASSRADAVGARIWRAVSKGISVLSFHTALDASPQAARVLSGALGLPDPETVLEAGSGENAGYGRICSGIGMDGAALARRCREAFARPNRLWGGSARILDSVCLWTGAAGNSPFECLEQGVDALVCGEVKYHVALDAAERGLCIVELGHDVSEQVHCPILVESIQRAGVPGDAINLLDLPQSWL